ncbi:MAG: hypothetical protein QOH88_2928 [Verrucomicrobiota bacterium]|jgi:hypothetical protein
MRSRSAISITRRWATVLPTLAAWLVISNHCALGLDETAAKPEAKSGGCPMHSPPAPEKPAPVNLPCCKDLRALAPSAVKNVTAAASQLVGLRDYAALIVQIPSRRTTLRLALDTGPPRALTFAESILQQSLLAHAPPADFVRL